MPKITDEDIIRAQAHVVGLLNEAEAVLTGWVLGEDQEQVTKLTGPLYEMCDREPASRTRGATS